MATVKLGTVTQGDQRNLIKAFRTTGMIVKSSFGNYIEDDSGKRYLDFTAGSTTAIGYSHPKLTQTLLKQVAAGFDHIDRYNGILQIESELSDEVKRVLPPKTSKGKIVFGHSGSDAVEKAIRLVRYATGHPFIVSSYEAHHGANATALSASPTKKEMGTNIISRFFELPGFIHIPFPDPYRPWFEDAEHEGQQCLAFFERIISNVLSPGLIAGVIIEPILSYGGNIVPPDGYFQGLQKICRKNEIPFIIDEVLTGIGKTGKMFALEHWNLDPDLICIGKALSGPLPLSLTVASIPLSDKWENKDYAGISKDGYVLGCAAAIEILRIVHDEKLVANSARVGSYLQSRLHDMKKDLKIAGDVRGLGLMMAIEFVISEKTTKPAASLVENVVSIAKKKGLLIGRVGAKGNVIRFLPSLTVEEKDVDVALKILEDSILQARS
ncbi:MAG: aminotransferase class III-fold pyridoxal phosphate-dependent enzyme [Thaumarchaeota archaeon]|nr:aminotransferase class III-fold pyridoxal phosphate-dependent enzyme [Nitrososphaerota archaeon]